MLTQSLNKINKFKSNIFQLDYIIVQICLKNFYYAQISKLIENSTFQVQKIYILSSYKKQIFKNSIHKNSLEKIL